MCYPLAKDAAHVAVVCYKNSYKNIYFYHLRTKLCLQLLKNNATTLDLLKGSVAILLGSREQLLKSSC